MSKSYKSTDFDPHFHPSQDPTHRHALDALLRKHGWKIHTRRGDHEPLWEKNRKIELQSIALAEIPDKEIEYAAHLQSLYVQGVYQ